MNWVALQMEIFRATGERLGAMTWSRALLILRQANLERRLKSPDKHEAGRAALEAERMTRDEEGD